MTNYLFQLLFYAVRAFWPSCKVSSGLPLSQALLESNSFRSPLYITYNNFFGMMQPKARDTTSNGPSPNGYATFSSALACIRDYFHWLNAFDIKTDEQLITFIRTRYATDPKYFAKVQSIQFALGGEIVSAGVLAAPAAAALLVAAVGVKVATS